jgi:nucleoside-diphosphate-sugar epimerase
MFGSILAAIYNQTTIIYPLAGVIPSAQIIVDGLKHTKASCAAIAPLFVEEISKKPELLDFLSKNLSSIFYSGGSVSAAVGEAISQKMKFYSIMGTTECGLFPTLHPGEAWPARDWADWNYFKFNPEARIGLQQISGDEYEAVITRDPDPAKEQPVFKVFPERKEYHTGDLYTAHPTKPDLWLYRGRSDDIIVFLTGEKTNPISMEESIAYHPEVRSVLVMGTLRFQAALLIELAAEERISTIQRAQVIERLWPIIQEANAECPRHAKIKKSHILFTDPEKPMLRAGKGTIQRRPTLGLYAKEIDDLYADADKASTSGTADVDIAEAPVDIKDSEAISSFISKTVAKFMDATAVSNDENFFLSGMDSLQALQLTRRLKCTLEVPDFEVSTIYANPSISLLTKTIMELSDEHEVSTVSRQASRVQGMEKVLNEYKAFIDEFSQSKMSECLTNGPSKGATEARVVLLTGSTGAIGSYMLQVLLDTPSVSHIYCLNRAADSRALQVTRNTTRGLPSDLATDRVSFLTADFGKDSLGLEPETYERLRSNVTDIVHNAWPVNFNMSLDTFRPHLSGVVNLIKLTTSTSHASSILFISSISSVLASTTSPITEKIMVDPLVALPMGYGESKYLAERILDYGGTVFPNVNISIARVGQVAGPAYAPGSWNKWEWFPSLVTSSLFLGIVPDSLGKEADVIDWIPIDFLATALMELALGRMNQDKGSGARVFHPVNSQPTSWSVLKPVIINVLNKISESKDQGKVITEAPLSAWVDRVREEAEKLDGTSGLEEMLEANPAIKLSGFYEGLVAGNGVPDVDGRMAMEGSEKLRSLDGVKSEWMEKWIQDWVRF